MNPTIQTYQLIAGNGNPIRKATKVILENGEEIRFMDKLSNKEAMKQAAYQLEKIARRNAGFSEARA